MRQPTQIRSARTIQIERLLAESDEIRDEWWRLCSDMLRALDDHEDYAVYHARAVELAKRETS